MTSRDFCYWLQGFFEIRGNVPEDDRTISSGQVAIIEKHLALVFKHEIDPSYGDKDKQEELNKIHNKPIRPGSPVSLEDKVYRC